MEGTIRELIVKRLDSQIKRLRAAKRKLSKRLLEDPKLEQKLNQLTSIRRRLLLANPTEAKNVDLPESAKGDNSRRSRVDAEAPKTKTAV